MRATSHQAAHPVTRLPRGDPVAEGRDLARELQAGNVGGHPGRRRVAPHPLQDVGAVDGRTPHAHEDLAS